MIAQEKPPPHKPYRNEFGELIYRDHWIDEVYFFDLETQMQCIDRDIERYDKGERKMELLRQRPDYYEACKSYFKKRAEIDSFNTLVLDWERLVTTFSHEEFFKRLDDRRINNELSGGTLEQFKELCPTLNFEKHGIYE